MNDLKTANLRCSRCLLAILPDPVSARPGMTDGRPGWQPTHPTLEPGIAQHSRTCQGGGGIGWFGTN
ncbi:hypothetical protein DPEC_G00346160 [Dallia pectoralis]|uniref:Uncharacterized protein n=1 Tax=Dallia pectoralis TaxID=75939 RepID=A0ACC2F3K3_DALPE|nr:hypothetical protein DPEC_G00346160 [Dallia pectoralis]